MGLQPVSVRLDRLRTGPTRRWILPALFRFVLDRRRGVRELRRNLGDLGRAVQRQQTGRFRRPVGWRHEFPRPKGVLGWIILRGPWLVFRCGPRGSPHRCLRGVRGRRGSPHRCLRGVRGWRGSPHRRLRGVRGRRGERVYPGRMAIPDVAGTSHAEQQNDRHRRCQFAFHPDRLPVDFGLVLATNHPPLLNYCRSTPGRQGHVASPAQGLPMDATFWYG